MTVNSSRVLAPCTVEFGSSNNTARLAMYQSDGIGPAMQTPASSFSNLRGGSWYTSIAAADAQKLWVGVVPGVGSSTKLLASADGGATWNVQTPCANEAVRDLAVIDASTVLAGTTARICRTTNGGALWTSVSPVIGNIATIEMVDATRGWALTTSGRVYQTADGGQSWTLQSTLPSGYWSGLSAVSTSEAFVSGTDYVSPTSHDLYSAHTTDGGLTFSLTNYLTGGPGSAAVAIHAVAPNVGLISCSGGTWRTINGGAAWTKVSNYCARSFTTTSTGDIVAAVDVDRIIRSTDGGATWTMTSMGAGTRAYPSDIASYGASSLWVVGLNEIAQASTNSGSSFTAMMPGRENLQAIAAFDAKRWVVAGTRGIAFRSTDGGATITTQDVKVAAPTALVDGIAWRDGTGILVGESSTIVRSTDFGATWDPVTSPVTTTFTAAVISGPVAWAGGSGGWVISSDDEGATWTTATQLPGAAPVTALTARDGVVWAGSTLGRVFRSTDRGTTWTPLTSGLAGTITAAWAFSDTDAVFAGSGTQEADLTTRLARTTDAGSSWTLQPILPTQPAARVSDLAFSADGSRGWGTIQSYGRYFTTVDGGATWTDTITGMGGSDGFARLSAGRILSVGTSENISISTPTAAIPDGISAAGSGFGTCLEAAGVGTSSTWVPAGTGACAIATLANWHPVELGPAPAAQLATSVTSTEAANVTLRFGLRIGSNQRAGDYVAELVFGVLAPGI